MKLSEHIRDAQRLLDQHGDLELTVEFTELYTNQFFFVREKGISPIAVATLKSGQKVACIDVEANIDEEDDEDELLDM